MGCLAVLFLSGCKGQEQPTWQEQYDLGMKYLAESHYEEAILAFTAAIEIDEKQVEAYIGRGDAYMGTMQATNEDASEANQHLEQYALAEKDYLFALELESTRKDVYEKLAALYLYGDDQENATNILQRGYDLLQESSLFKRLQELLTFNYTKQDVLTAADVTITGWTPSTTLETMPMQATVTYPLLIYNGEQMDFSTFEQGDFSSEMAAVQALMSQIETKGSICGDGAGTWATFWEDKLVDVYTQIGPRGVTIGMSMPDVLQRFACENKKILNAANTQTLEEYLKANGTLVQSEGDGEATNYYYDNVYGSLDITNIELEMAPEEPSAAAFAFDEPIEFSVSPETEESSYVSVAIYYIEPEQNICVFLGFDDTQKVTVIMYAFLDNGRTMKDYVIVG